MIDIKSLSEEALDEVAEGFESIEECDRMSFLFIQNPWVLHKTVEWAKSQKLYVKRSAFVLMCALAQRDEHHKNFVFRVFLPILQRESVDERSEIQEVIVDAFVAIAQRNEKLKKSVFETIKSLDPVLQVSIQKACELLA